MSDVKPDPVVIYGFLDEIIDPELGLGLGELGLLYDVKVEDSGDVEVIMTLTSMGCPYGEELIKQVEEEAARAPAVGKVKVTVTFDPPWDPSYMSDDAKFALGMGW